MIGDMIAKVRKEKGMTKTELASLTDINIGHLTHIEKGERNPSHKALKNICKALDIPYQQLMYTYDKTVSEEQEQYHLIDHIAYKEKHLFSSMFPTLEKNSYAFLEFNSLLNNKDIGLFSVNKKTIIRRFYNKKGKITLKADNKDFDDIVLTPEDSFFIIGKFLTK